MTLRTIALAGALPLVALLTALAAPASAHGEDGVLTVTAAEQVASDRVRVEVGIVYANDAEPAEEAVVSATLTRGDGQVVGPVALPQTSGGLYGAEIDVPGPGAWQVAVTSTTPAAEGSAAIEVAEAPATTAAPEPTERTAGDSTDTSIDNDDAEPALLAAPSDDADDGDSGAAIVIAGVLGVLVIAAVAGYVVYRRRTTPPAT